MPSNRSARLRTACRCGERSAGVRVRSLPALLLIGALHAGIALAASAPAAPDDDTKATSSGADQKSAPTPPGAAADRRNPPVERPFVPSEQVSPDQEVDFPADL